MDSNTERFDIRSYASLLRAQSYLTERMTRWQSHLRDICRIPSAHHDSSAIWFGLNLIYDLLQLVNTLYEKDSRVHSAQLLHSYINVGVDPPRMGIGVNYKININIFHYAYSPVLETNTNTRFCTKALTLNIMKINHTGRPKKQNPKSTRRQK